ncbi:CYTH domain-containing protein [Bacillus piscicola]|uniref:CYTH domain-containing protein n=1 Tax=Bacillus piscicola TaxID=1632684 RepID=UPI001F09A306|nr:CYTH domain-containing protein [Bacillus piscicola]
MMAQEKEFEKKNLLTSIEFNRLTQAFQFQDEDFTLQVNTYFDTADFLLKEQRAALRIREKNGHFTLTLKQPAASGLLETHQTLTSAEAKYAFETGRLPAGETVSQIQSMSKINMEDLKKLGSLQTKRAQVPFRNGTLFLDHSIYLDTEDYEVEFEASSIESAAAGLSQLLKKYRIESRPTPNKMERFFHRKLASD